MRSLVHSCWRLSFVSAIVALLLSASAATAATIFVDPAATGNQTGNSWANAFHTMQAALDWAADEEESPGPDEIWVKAGTYYPTQATTIDDQSKTFLITQTPEDVPNQIPGESVQLWGHFHGDEALKSERDLNDPDDETILSGDLDHDDENGFDDPSWDENAWNIITVSGENGPVTNATIISGFTIEHGYASCDGNCLDFEITNCLNTDTIELIIGGGGAIQCVDDASPRIERCHIRDNAGQYGGAMRISNCSSPLIVRCRFERNVAVSSNGGAIFSCDRGFGHVVNCEFVGNACGHVGGAVAGRNMHPEDATITNCIFVGNHAGDWGGSVRAGMDAGLKLINCTLTANTAGPGTCGQPAAGGAIAVGGTAAGMPGDRTAILENCIVWGNSLIDDTEDEIDPAGGDEIAIVKGPGVLRVTNCNVKGGEDAVLDDYVFTECCANNCSPENTLYWTENTNIGEELVDHAPLFLVAPHDGGDGWGNSNDNYGDLRLAYGSASINAGSSALLPLDVADLDGMNGTGHAITRDFAEQIRTAACLTDIGAYEKDRFRCCPGDTSGDDFTGIADLLMVIGSWGVCAPPCPADLEANGGGTDYCADGLVGIQDLLAVIGDCGCTCNEQTGEPEGGEDMPQSVSDCMDFASQAGTLGSSAYELAFDTCVQSLCNRRSSTASEHTTEGASTVEKSCEQGSSPCTQLAALAVWHPTSTHIGGDSIARGIAGGVLLGAGQVAVGAHEHDVMREDRLAERIARSEAESRRAAGVDGRHVVGG